MKKLQKEGKATKDAVDDAEKNLTVAALNLSLAQLKLLSAAEKTKTASLTLGFYADSKLTRTGDKTNITSDSSQETPSNLIAANDININSGSSLSGENPSDVGNTNIKGNIQSVNANVNITSFNNTNIDALESESSSSTKTQGFTETVTVGASYGNSSTDALINSITAQISKRTGKSDSSNINYTNTSVVANNGAININSTNNDTNISGANLIANDITITSGGDLNVESLQNVSRSKSKSQSIGGGGGSGSGSLSYSSNRNSFKRDWVDDQTSIIANNALRINTDGNTDLKGAVISSNDNDLVINTGTLTFSDIIDTEKQESSGIGISTNISLDKDSRNPNANNQNQDKGYYPNGSTSLSIINTGYEKEQITRATIGSGVINITNEASQSQDIANLNRDMNLAQEITKDTITGALDVAITVDNRLIGAALGNDAARGSLNETINVGGRQISKGVNYGKDTLSIPVETIYETYTQKDEGGTNIADSMIGKYSTLNDMMFNSTLSANDLAKNSQEVVFYNGDQINQDSDASQLLGFYDRESGVIAVNADQNNSNSELAGTIAHENYHARIANSGKSYTSAEENTAHNIGDFTKDRWNNYQGDNDSFGSIISNANNTNIANNFYANGVEVGTNINPLNPWGITDNPYDKKFEEKKAKLNEFAKDVREDSVIAGERTLIAPIYRGLSSATDYGAFAEYGENSQIKINEEIIENPYHFNDQSHEYAAEGWGSYVDNQFVAGGLRAIGEYLIQVPKYSYLYDQHHPKNHKYDPLGVYDSILGGNKPEINDRGELMTGAGYWHDAIDDITNSVNGANQNFNYIQDKQQYDQLFNQWKNERDNKNN